MKIITPAPFAFALLLAGAAVTAAQAQPEDEIFGKRIIAKIQSYQQTGKAGIGTLNGLWRRSGGRDTNSSSIRSIMHVNDVLIYSVVDLKTTLLTPVGYAEQTNGQWHGWWSLVCRDCCPGVGWWDKGVLLHSPGKSARIHIVSKKMDEEKCVLTETPDEIDFDLERVTCLKFKELIPGKLIHIVAAPAVGNQASQYKEAVKLQWNLTGLGITHFTLAMPGRGALIQRGTNLEGEYEHLTDRSGKCEFMLVGFNAKDQPLHLEPISIDIPAIPGIGR